MTEELFAPTDEVVAVVPPNRTRPGAGRDAEFVVFVTDHSQELMRTAWLLVGDKQLADDLVQETLTRTFVAWSRAREGEPLAYARRVLVNLRVDTRRRHRREALIDPGLMPDSPITGQQERADDRDQLVRVLAALTPRQRRIVVLRYYADLSETDVAADLGISVGAVKSISSRALAGLRATAPAPTTQDGGERR